MRDDGFRGLASSARLARLAATTAGLNRMAAMAALVAAAGLAGCAGGGQAPIESRTSGGVLASEQVARQSGGAARAGGAGGLGSTAGAATPSRANASASLDRPVSPGPAAEVGAPGMGAPIGGGSGIKSTPLVVETLRTPESGAPRGGSATTPPRLTAQPMPEPRLESRVDSRTSQLATPSSAAASGSSASANSGPATTASAASAESQTNWVWPAAGRVLQSFEPGKTKGMTLSGTLGDPIIAVADGKVIFSGQGPRGYGNLIIIKHPGDLLSVYAHNRAVLVKEGASVVRGQRIAELGDTDSDRPKLHFEVRRQGRPIDPIQMLPGR